jgi:nucleotide sugar dehydrogenase
VIGVELPTISGSERAHRLNTGSFPFTTPDALLAEAIAQANREGNLVATTNAAAFQLATVAVVDVNLDVIDSGNDQPSVSLKGFETAIRTLGRELPSGALVIIETTVPPGTCANLVAPVLAEELRARNLGPDAILLAHSYERVMPGPDYFDSVVNYWRVYAGHTAKAAERCEEILSHVINVREFPLRRLSSITASETAKVLENSYRATNIAFIEEWARLAEAAGIDLFEVVTAIRDRPTHSNIRQPGFGVGGYCLPKDPLFAAVAASLFLNAGQLRFPFCRLAAETNKRMPIENLDRLEAFIGGLDGKSIILLGVAYRSEVDDTRASPAEIFCREAMRRGATLLCHDPYVRHWSELNIPISHTLSDPAGIDAVVFAVPHQAYRRLDVASWLGSTRPFVYDCDNVLSAEVRKGLRAIGVKVESTGRGIGL